MKSIFTLLFLFLFCFHSEAQDYYTLPDSTIKNKTKHFFHHRISINGGGSYLLGAVDKTLDPVLQEYLQDLKIGYHFRIDYDYFITKYFGVGATTSLFKTKNQLDDIYIVTNTGQIKTGILKDDIGIQYYAPTLVLSNGKNLVTHISVGYLYYKNYAMVVDKFTLSGSSLGISLGIGFDFLSTDNMKFGVILSSTLGALSEYKLDDGITKQTIQLPPEQYETLSRIDIALGIRWFK